MHLLRKLEREEEERILREYEQSLAQQGILVQTDGFFLRRFSVFLRGAAGMLLGGLIGAIAVFLSFIILNLVLHVSG